MSESKEKVMGADKSGILAGLLEALGDKHSELDINLHNVTVKLPSMQSGVELNGVVTLTIHLRDMTEDEKKASAARSIEMMSTA